jgi:peroxiredoxin
LESVRYCDRTDELTECGAVVVGVSTQRPEEQAAFARKQRLGFPLFSDRELELAAALRLPTFRVGGADRLKRVTLLVRSDREIRAVLYPMPDPARSVDDVLAKLDQQTRMAA